MQPRAFIVHCWGGSPDSFWYGWLAKELTAAGFLVCVLRMPDPNNPQVDSWVQKLRDAVGCVRPSDIFVGHSVGSQTIMRMLKKQLNTCMGIVMVAPWLELKELDEEARATAREWVEPTFEAKVVASRTRRWGILLSDDDPWVDLPSQRMAFESAFEGRTSVKELAGRGHFDSESQGDKKIPEVIALLKEWQILV